jgi:hypothetical protein
MSDEKNQIIAFKIHPEFHCNICDTTQLTLPTKYECSSYNCTEKICDKCFVNHVNIKQTCAFCRSPLIIDQKDLPAVVVMGDPRRETLNISYIHSEYRRMIILILIICTIWYSILFALLFQNSPRDKEDN